jgi:phage shock protein C
MDPTRKLYRSRANKQVAGVCGGLAAYFNVDVTLMRVLFILLGLLGAAGIVVYIAMWIIVPLEPPVGGAP